MIDNIITTDFLNPSLKKEINKSDVPIYFMINLTKKHSNQKNSTMLKKRVFSQSNINPFKEQLSLLHWGHINSINLKKDANIIYEKFSKTILEINGMNFLFKDYILKEKDAALHRHG